jgi:hypothetical protein
MTDETPAILGADSVVAWFGKWPSFHDAEILEVHLNREGPSWVRLHSWLTTAVTHEKDGKQDGVSDRHAVVTFLLTDVTDLELCDFSVQNVISRLTVEPSPSGFRLSLSPCFGVSGFIEAREIRAEVKPGMHRRDDTLRSRNA